jgi:hypothetical protein
MSADSEPDVPSGSEAMHPAPRRTARVVCCPQCGSTRIRRPTRPLVLNVVACIVFLLLTPVLCAMILGLLLALLVLPVTMCIALVGRDRCRDCQHRFDPEYRGVEKQMTPVFPWRLHALNILTLVAFCGVGPYLIGRRSAGGRLPDMMENAGTFMVLGFLLWASLLWHLVLYRRLRQRLANPVIWALLFVLPGVLGGMVVLYQSLPQVRAGVLLRLADLAPLPKSATAIHVYSWSSPFSGEDFLCFTARSADIESFLSESPALQRQEPTHFWARKMRLPYPKEYPPTWDPASDANEYFAPRSHWPSWYQQEIRGPARKYIVQPPRYQYPGEVLVDDETNTVYVYLCFS